MNCQPNDFCRVLNNPVTALGGIADRFVTVMALDQNQCSEPAWIIEGGAFRTVQGFKVQCIPDKWLKPIRDPGDDAVDEMVRKVGTPEGVPA